MLNGIAPILIFNFKKNILDSTENIPLLPKVLTSIPFPPIPIYLDEKLTGIYIENENKNIDIETEPNTMPEGDTPIVTQKGVNSSVTINMLAKRDSVGVVVLMAFNDQIFQKVTSQEYSVTYISGAMSIFNGRLQSLSVAQESDNDKLNISLTLSKANNSGTKEVAALVPSVPNVGTVAGF